MSKLITDDFVRGTAKIMLLAIMVFLMTVCLLFAVVVLLRILGYIQVEDTIPNNFIKALTISFKSEFASFITIVVGVFPSLVSAVCYLRDKQSGEPKMTETMNKTGHAFFILIIVSIILTMIDVLMLSVIEPKRVLGDPTYREPLKNLFTGMLSFLTIYLVQLLGLKPK